MSTVKNVVIGAKAKSELKKGVDILADAVKATLGPRGRHVAIERSAGPPLITKDGVTVARSIYLLDRVQNMGAQLIKSVASAANSAAGDGTTTATVLAQAIFDKGYSAVTAGHNPVLIKRGIDIAVENVVKNLALNSMKISDENSIRNVAIISANNDVGLGTLIAEVVTAVGDYGFITVQESPGMETGISYVEGLSIDRGIISGDFVSNPNKLTCEMENAYVLCYDDKLDSIHDIADLLTEVANVGRPLLIIAKDYSEAAAAHILFNRVKNGLDFCAIKAPGYGDTRREMLKDIAVMTGGALIHNDHGRKFEGVTIKELGTAKQISAGLNQTSIVDGGGNAAEIKKRVETLESQIKNAAGHTYQVDNIKERVSRLTGGIAVFKVGGASESEVKEKKDRVEDAINAVRSALAEGVVAGGGAALVQAGKELPELLMGDLIEEEKVGINIVREAIKSPLIQILQNSGDMDRYYEIITYLEKNGVMCGYDALKRKLVPNMLEQGIIDPAKVVRSALQQAASASGTLLTTEVTISVMDEPTAE